MKIISVKRRNWFARFLSIEEWRVGVQMDSGKVKYFNCWAGVRDPSTDTLLRDLKSKLEFQPDTLVGQNL